MNKLKSPNFQILKTSFLKKVLLIMMKNSFIAASVNVNELDEEAKKFPIVTKVEKNVELNSVMSNSFGFGGTNATLVFEKV